MQQECGKSKPKRSKQGRRRVCSVSWKSVAWYIKLLGLSVCSYEYTYLIFEFCSGRDKLDQLMTDKRIGAYVGIDPTASSLHVGHLLPLMSIFWMYVHGYHSVSLLGGATSKVGDPTDRLKSREKTHRATHTANMVAMHYQLKKLWLNVENYGRKYGYNWEWPWHRELVNNNTWMNKLPIMDVLQILGPGMRIGTMLGRDT
jgi:tyrosyl-tRNA synthetase